MHNHQTIDSFRVSINVLTQVLLLTWGSTALAGPAGKFIYSFGDVKVTSRSGESHAAAKGQILNEGDLISAGADGSAQIQMQDQGMLAVRANTKVLIDEFRYQGKQDGSERSVMTLLQGGLRAITGAVGNQNKQNYRINTPTATIGIRGTDHEPFVVPEGSHPFGQAQPGTYDKVNTGEAYIQTPLGKVAIQPNQVGFAGASNARPMLLPAVPTLFKATPPEKPGDTKQGKPDDRPAARNEQPKPGGNDRPPAEGNPPPPPPPPAPAGAMASPPPLMPVGPDNRAIQTPITASAGAGSVNFTSQQATTASGQIVDGNTPLVWPGQLPVVAGAADDSAKQQSGPGAGSEYGSGVQADLFGRLLRIQNGTFYFDHGTAQLAEVGRLSMALKDGQAMPVVWGRWHAVPPDQLFSITDAGKVLQPTGNMHYAAAPIMTALDQLNQANLGIKAASYSLLAGTQPSTELPNSAGSLQSLDILVDFSAQQISDYKLQLSVSGRTYTASAAQKVGLGSQFIVPLQASCSGCTTATVSGEAEGAFIGPKAEGIITGYALGKNSTEYTYGAAVLGFSKSLTSLPGSGSNTSLAMVGADMELTTAGTYATGAGVHNSGGINLDGNGNVIGLNQGTFVFAAHTAPLTDSGSVLLPVDGGGQQKINWGRWEKQSSTATFQVSNNNNLKNSVGSFHFLTADQISSATSLSSAAMGGTTATYSLLGGTHPTSEISGEIGTLRSLQATVDFAQQKISSYQLQVDFANRSFKANGGGVTIAPTFSVGLTGDCQGCSTANPAALIPVSGQANGAFIGPKAEGMISSFGLQTQNADRAVSGVAVLKR